MEFEKLIAARYSCKRFSDKKIESEKLQKILEAGRLAPTAKNAQAQRVYVLQSETALAKLDRHTPCRYNAGTVLAVAYKKADIFVLPGGIHNSGEQDASIVAVHMMLSAKNEGIESCWLNFFNPEETAADLGIPEDEQLVMLLDLGYPDEEKGHPLENHNLRKGLNETVKYL